VGLVQCVEQAAWSLGEVAPLLSLPRTMFATLGPGQNPNRSVCWLKIDTPRISEGRRSRVN
jgi:hypothetical protein